MKPIDLIVRRLTIFYYIFLIATLASLVMAFVTGFAQAIQGRAAGDFISQSITVEIAYVILALLTMVNSVWLLLLFVKMLIIVYKSIRDKDLFNARLIKIIPRFVVLYIILMVLAYIAFCLKGSSSLEMSMYDFSVEILSSISTVIMLLMFCEVLKIGNILKTEQDLTV